MKLQILINYYNESELIIGRLLHSIDIQEGISFKDVEVLVYSDGKDNILSSDFLNSFRFPIKYKVLEHRGVCATRNALMDDATAEYIMFCDADDCFNSTLGLYKLFKAINDLNNIPVIGSYFDHEILKDDHYEYETAKNDTIHVHGKIFNREYLIKNNIRFPDEMTFSGDMYFLWLAYNLNPNYAWIKESFYTWKYNKDSITRRHDHYKLRTYDVVLKNYTLLMENLIERERYDLRDILAAAVCQMMYVNYTNEKYMEGPEEFIICTKNAMIKFIKKYGCYYENLSDNIKKEVYKVTLSLHQEGPNCKGVSGVEQWMKDMLNK